MIELPLVFVSGVLGSGHCLGMCGPFVLAIGGAAQSRRQAATRQVVFTVGRLTSYGFLGAVAGAAGLWIGQFESSLIQVSAVLAFLAGLFLVYQGLVSAGLVRPRIWTKSAAGCAAARAYSSLLTAPGIGPVYLAGLLTGLMPCGLLYGFVALAATTHNVFYGLVVMCVFGLGTAPALMIVGWGSSIASAVFRQRLLKAAAWCVVLTGIIAMTRGVVVLAGTREATATDSQVCPFCSQQHEH